MDNLTELSLSGNNLTHYQYTKCLVLEKPKVHHHQHLEESGSDAITSTNLKNVPCTRYNEKYVCHGIAANNMNMLPDNIVYLAISDAPLHVIGRSAFSRFSRTLEYLRCRNCSIKYIGYQVFSGIGQLRTFILDNNELENITADAFENNIKLVELYLRSNGIKGAIFSEMPNLRRLHLGNNNLRCLDLDSLLPLREHLLFDISNNPDLTVTCVTEMRRKKITFHVEMSKWLQSYSHPLG